MLATAPGDRQLLRNTFEEVADGFPDLVAHSADGRIETVKRQMLDSPRLNEVQRQEAETRGLKERLVTK